MLPRGVLRESSSALVFMMRLVDLLAIMGTGILAHRIQFGIWILNESYQLAIALGLICSIIFFGYFSLSGMARNFGGYRNPNAYKRMGDYLHRPPVYSDHNRGLCPFSE